jgi:hypothetical protein
VSHEIANGHFARADESRDTSKKSQGDQSATGDFDNSGSEQQQRERIWRAGLGRRKIEKFHQPMLHEEQGGHDP